MITFFTSYYDNEILLWTHMVFVKSKNLSNSWSYHDFRCGDKQWLPKRSLSTIIFKQDSVPTICMVAALDRIKHSNLQMMEEWTAHHHQFWNGGLLDVVPITSCAFHGSNRWQRSVPWLIRRSESVASTSLV